MNKMMNKKSFVSLLLLLITFTLMGTGCGQASSSNSSELTTKKLVEFYPGDISRVDAITITDGSTGEKKLFMTQQQIQEWINQIKDIEFVPDTNQEGRTGYLFHVSLSEGQEEKLVFNTNSLDDHYYLYNEDLKNSIQHFFETADDYGRLN